MFRQSRPAHVLLCRVWEISKTEELRSETSLATLWRTALAQTERRTEDASVVAKSKGSRFAINSVESRRRYNTAAYKQDAFEIKGEEDI